MELAADRYEKPKPSGLSAQTIGVIAEKLSLASDYIEHRDIYEYVDDIGGRVQLVDFWVNGDSDGTLIVQDRSDFVINIPTHTSISRDTFTIAHELGHYYIHYLMKYKEPEFPKFIANRYGASAVEYEANLFAANFLMPKGLFTQKYSEFDGDVFELKSYFCVSASAARIRGESLGLIQ